MLELITPNLLKELVAANVVCSAEVVGEKGGYVVLVKYGVGERVVAARDNTGHIKRRIFASLDSVDNFLRKIVHIVDYRVASANFEAAPRQARYEKNSARLKEVHESAAYDKWFRSQVQEALDDPRPAIPHEDIKKEFAALRAELALKAKL
ncbi:hypothetical protein [Solimicrobium silvestre]|uniref:Stability determinant domain-containing protein n=1 Tax=Solimicrobium silvestre TaxID=2099400 RepID=A0A2S9GZS3_9BURK|nr:hypothetical protein [Solimicrobium silvestre]PRC93232.1 hypothetical protein S2091_1970 [Solimicrobium silvestre]